MPKNDSGRDPQYERYLQDRRDAFQGAASLGKWILTTLLALNGAGLLKLADSYSTLGAGAQRVSAFFVWGALLVLLSAICSIGWLVIRATYHPNQTDKERKSASRAFDLMAAGLGLSAVGSLGCFVFGADAYIKATSAAQQPAPGAASKQSGSATQSPDMKGALTTAGASPTNGGPDRGASQSVRESAAAKSKANKDGIR